jgi:hypothetical protein
MRIQDIEELPADNDNDKVTLSAFYLPHKESESN